ncbi:MAG TPA: hypothetical protein VM491_05755 [Burkholderiaceae bacterium]|nr:hypothetical protein [Burkholderiaceae bacterium]
MSASRVLILATAVLPLATLASPPPLPKEGKYDMTLCWGGTSHAVSATPNDHFGTYALTGPVRSNAETRLFDQASFDCVGTWAVRASAHQHAGYCLVVDRDGDKAFFRDVRDGDGYTAAFLGGTGKYRGIAGGGTTERIGAYPPARAGSIQGCARSSGNYKLP